MDSLSVHDCTNNESAPDSLSHGTLSEQPLARYRLPTSLSDDLPNCAQSPSDGLSHSTTDDTDPSNAPSRHSDLVDGHRLRGCARHDRGSLCPVLLPPFRLHVGTSLFHRRARGVLPQITKAPTPLRLLLLTFQIVDSKVYPPIFAGPQPVALLRIPSISIANCAAWGTPGTLLQCRTCSIHGRRCKTRGRPRGATNHTAGSGCEGWTGRGSSLDRARDPRHRTGHARGRTCPRIMTQCGCTE
jgi:hypothetical protein